MKSNINNKIIHVDAIITSIKSYGFFVKFYLDKKLNNGFVHISEIEDTNEKALQCISRIKEGIEVRLEILEYQENNNRYLLSWKNIDKPDRCKNFLLIKDNPKNNFSKLKEATKEQIDLFDLNSFKNN